MTLSYTYRNPVPFPFPFPFSLAFPSPPPLSGHPYIIHYYYYYDNSRKTLCPELPKVLLLFTPTTPSCSAVAFPILCIRTAKVAKTEHHQKETRLAETEDHRSAAPCCASNYSDVLTEHCIRLDPSHTEKVRQLKSKML